MVFEALAGSAAGATATIGVAFLLGVALAEWGKFRSKAEKGFNWIALGGVWLVFAGATGVASATAVFGLGDILATVSGIFGIVGWIFALIGTIFAAYEVLVER